MAERAGSWGQGWGKGSRREVSPPPPWFSSRTNEAKRRRKKQAVSVLEFLDNAFSPVLGHVELWTGLHGLEVRGEKKLE